VFGDLGIAERVIAHGRMAMPMRSTSPDGQVTLGGAEPPELRNRPELPYTTSLITPEWRTEEALRSRLADFGGAVEFGTGLTSFEQSEEGVSAVVVRAGRTATISASWLVGCDGGHSIVRTGAGIPFVGETREELRMIVADVRVDGLDGDAWDLWRHAEGLVSLCPLPSTDAFQYQAGIAPGQDPSLTLANTRLKQTIETNAISNRRDASILQLGVGYRGSVLARDDRDESATLRAGDRAPDATGLKTPDGEHRLFELTRGGRFVLLNFGPDVSTGVRTIRGDVAGQVADIYGATDRTLVLIRGRLHRTDLRRPRRHRGARLSERLPGDDPFGARLKRTELNRAHRDAAFLGGGKALQVGDHALARRDETAPDRVAGRAIGVVPVAGLPFDALEGAAARPERDVDGRAGLVDRLGRHVHLLVGRVVEPEERAAVDPARSPRLVHDVDQTLLRADRRRVVALGRDGDADVGVAAEPDLRRRRRGDRDATAAGRFGARGGLASPRRRAARRGAGAR
jgi:hypothetical protein